MFEKEAEERARKLEESQTLGVYDNDEDLARDSGWNDGEVAGYEKGFRDGAEFGYSKANEWHYVKDGDLPKEDLRPRTLGYYLTASKHISYKGFVFEVAYFTGVIFIKGGDILDNVVAWKEIVLPELKELEQL